MVSSMILYYTGSIYLLWVQSSIIYGSILRHDPSVAEWKALDICVCNVTDIILYHVICQYSTTHKKQTVDTIVHGEI